MQFVGTYTGYFLVHDHDLHSVDLIHPAFVSVSFAFSISLSTPEVVTVAAGALLSNGGAEASDADVLRFLDQGSGFLGGNIIMGGGAVVNTSGMALTMQMSLFEIGSGISGGWSWSCTWAKDPSRNFHLPGC